MGHPVTEERAWNVETGGCAPSAPRRSSAGVLLAGAGPVHAATLSAGGLEANANRGPLGIDDATPTLSWRLSSTRPRRRCRRSTASWWRRPRRRPRRARATCGTRARSRSDRNTAVYAGPALASRTRYYWSVRSWAGADRVGLGGRRLVRDGVREPVRVEGHWISGPAAARGGADRPRRAPRTTTAACRARDARPRPPPPAARCCAWQQRPNFFVGKAVTLDGGADQESVKIESIGTPASTTTTAAPASCGRHERQGRQRGEPGGRRAADDRRRRRSTITSVGTAAGAATTLFAPGRRG